MRFLDFCLSLAVALAAFTGVLLVILLLAEAALGDDAKLADFPPTTGRYRVVVLRIIDGDSCEVGFITPVKARIWGIDAPELKTPEGKAARDYLKSVLKEGSVTTANCFGREKFGRHLLDLQANSKDTEGFWLSKLMVEVGMANKWDGTGPRP